MPEAIPFSKFVDITATSLSDNFTFNRLNGIVITKPDLPLPKIITCKSLEEVGLKYSTTSKEYEYASTFFSYTSKTATKPEKLTFYNVNITGKNNLVGGICNNLESVKINGAFAILINHQEIVIEADLTACTSMTEIAEMIQAKFQEKLQADPSSVDSETVSENNIEVTVAYDSTMQSFVIATSKDIEINYAYSVEGKESLAKVLKIGATNGSYICSYMEDNKMEILRDVANMNGDYYSISFIEQIADTHFNNMAGLIDDSKGRYLLIIRSNDERLLSGNIVYQDLFKYDGTALIYGENIKLSATLQAAIASIDYTTNNGAHNFNFLECPEFENIAITKSHELDSINSNKANTAYIMGGYGQSICLFGEGNIFGTNFTDISSYVGNSWIKAKFEIAVSNLLINNPLISLRGGMGSSLILSNLQDIITTAKMGGIITTVGVNNLTASEKSAVITATNNSEAINTIEQNGYYIKVLNPTADDVAKKQMRVMFIYTRNVPTNRVVISTYIL